MWQEVGEVAADLLLPNPGPDVDRIFEKKNPDQLRVPLIEKDAFKRRLTQSGWFDEEIVAAGMLNQGNAQSLVSLLTGWALVEMVRGRRCKSLSRDFCLAVTSTGWWRLTSAPWPRGARAATWSSGSSVGSAAPGLAGRSGSTGMSAT